MIRGLRVDVFVDAIEFIVDERALILEKTLGAPAAVGGSDRRLAR